MPQAVAKLLQTPQLKQSNQTQRKQPAGDDSRFEDSLRKAHEKPSDCLEAATSTSSEKTSKSRRSEAKPAREEEVQPEVQAETKLEKPEAPSEGTETTDSADQDQTETPTDTGGEKNDADEQQDPTTAAALVAGTMITNTAGASVDDSVDSQGDAKEDQTIDSLLTQSPQLAAADADAAGEHSIKLPHSLAEQVDVSAEEFTAKANKVIESSPTSADETTAEQKAAANADLDPAKEAMFAEMRKQEPGYEAQPSDTQPVIAPDVSSTKPQAPVTAPKPAPVQHPAYVAAEIEFARANHESIVQQVRSELLPNGGTMRMRLDPPELGPMQVSIHLRDGVMMASFETTTDNATKLLSHSLSDLRTALESQGVHVDKLQVQQSPKDSSANSRGGEDPRQQQQQGGLDSQTARQEQQRREMLRRMWRRLAGGGDPLDLVA